MFKHPPFGSARQSKGKTNTDTLEKQGHNRITRNAKRRQSEDKRVQSKFRTKAKPENINIKMTHEDKPKQLKQISENQFRPRQTHPRSTFGHFWLYWAILGHCRNTFGAILVDSGFVYEPGGGLADHLMII